MVCNETLQNYADELFGRVSPFCGIGAKRVKIIKLIRLLVESKTYIFKLKYRRVFRIWHFSHMLKGCSGCKIIGKKDNV